MTEDEQIQICKVLAVLSMWGHGWVGSTVTEHLDKGGPVGARSWQDVYRENMKPAQRASVGMVTDPEMLTYYLSRGYWLCNWDEEGCSLFNPPPMNGLYRYVSKELADANRQRNRTSTTDFSFISALLSDKR